MATLSFSDDVIDVYFGEYLRNLDVDSKKRVIAKFVDSLVNPPPPTEDRGHGMTLDELIDKYGPWDGPENLEEARVGYIRRQDEES